MAQAKFSARCQGGFTLVELLVAITVLVVMMSFLAAILSTSQLSLSMLGNSASRRQDASTVLANMAKDLRASLHSLNQSYEIADPASGQFQLLINPSGVPTTSGLCNPNTIFWSASVSNSAGGAGLIGYFVRWGTTPSGAPQPQLCRMFLNAAETAPQLGTMQTAAVPNQWADTALVNSYAPADINSGYQGWLADNVIAFYVRALDPGMIPINKYAVGMRVAPWGDYAAGGQGCLTVQFANAPGAPSQNQYDSRQGYEYVPSGTGTTIDRYGPVLPAAIELVIIVAEPKDIARLTGPVFASSTYDPAQDMWTNVNTFMASLPVPLNNSARAYSTIVVP